MHSATLTASWLMAMFLGKAITAASATASMAPCDIYAAGNTPCVAAHSTTRILYAGYTGPLYQVRRNSDSQTVLVYPLSNTGVANATIQDSFCVNTTCTILTIYDQSPFNNTLTRGPGGPGGFGSDNLASAIGAPVTLNGQKAYGVFIPPGTGYRNDATLGVAMGNATAQGIYAVLDGTHYNTGCCFDYGNAERTNNDTGGGSMETLNYGGTGGPFIRADLENGVFTGYTQKPASSNLAISYRFVTGIVKSNISNVYALKGGNAQSGNLSTFYNGPRPAGYGQLHLSGAIVLGVGGDNSNGAQGTFYEGTMTATYPSNDTEDAVQANIVAAGYATTSLVSGPAVNVGSNVTFQLTTPGLTGDYIMYNGTNFTYAAITPSSPLALRQNATYTVRTGLGFAGCVSFESVAAPGNYIWHNGTYALQLGFNTTQAFNEGATWCPQGALNGQGSSLRSWSTPTRYFRQYKGIFYAAAEEAKFAFDAVAGYNNDVSFVVGSGFAS